MITFKFSIKQIYSNSFKFVFINLKLNLLCLFSLAVVYGINVGLVFLFSDFFYLVVTLEVLIYLMTYPAFRFLLVQYCIFPSVKKYIIDPYYKEHPGEDIEKRRDLGIEIEETATKTDGNDGIEDDTSVFKD